MATGITKFTGGGEKNITGAILSGGEVQDDTIGGNILVLYCSSA